MNFDRPIVLGARASVLSQVQARLVGDALLARHPGIEVRYALKSAAGDRNPHASLPELLRSGGFTADLSAALDAGSVDIAVHSWKDLPFASRAHTEVIATLSRADARDLLLVRRDWLDAPQRASLRVLSSSARRSTNLGGFLQWALPLRPAPEVTFVPVRGDIERRLELLMSCDCSALVIAKAAVDRLLESSAVDFAPVRERLRAVLAACELMVLPLALNPTAPGQGALALETRRDRADLAALLATINHEPSFRRVQAERSPLADAGHEDQPFGVSIVPLRTFNVEWGEVEFTRGQRGGHWVQGAELRRNASPLPRARCDDAIWTGETAGDEPYRRVALPVRHDRFDDARCGLFVARSEAWPDGYTPRPGQVVWSAGIDTWRRLAARGIWVHGSDESLGESGAVAARALFPRVRSWVKFSHQQGYDSPHSERVATYRLERSAPLADVRGRTHFYWRSGSQFFDYLEANPGIRDAWHGCGPGNTFSMIRAAIGEERVRAFLSADGFREEVAA